MHDPIELDGATLQWNRWNNAWELTGAEIQSPVTADWGDWVELARAILAEDEIRHRRAAGELE